MVFRTIIDIVLWSYQYARQGSIDGGVGNSVVIPGYPSATSQELFQEG